MSWRQKLTEWLLQFDMTDPIKGYLVKDGIQIPLQINATIIAQYELKIGKTLSLEEQEVLYQKNTHHFLLLAFFCDFYGIAYPPMSNYVGNESKYGNLLATLLCEAGCAVVLFPLSNMGVPIADHSRDRYNEIPPSIMVVPHQLAIYSDKQISFILMMLTEWKIPLKVYSQCITEDGLIPGIEYETIDVFRQALEAVRSHQKEIGRGKNV